MPSNFIAVGCDIDEIRKTDVNCNSSDSLNGKNPSRMIMGEETDRNSQEEGTYYLETNNVFPLGRGDQNGY